MLKSGQHDDAVYRELWDTILAGRVWRAELINRRKDGSLYTEEQSITPVRDTNGHITHFVSIKQDVTTRKQAEAALQASETRYRRLFETVADAIHIYDAGTLQFIDANEAGARLYGYSRDELLRLKASDLSTDVAATRAAAAAAVAQKLTHIPVRYHKRKDGTVFPVEITSSAFELNGRHVICGVLRDITERKQAEAALQASETRYRRLFETVSDAIHLFDAETLEYVDVNETATKLYGYTREEFLRLKATDVTANVAAAMTTIKAVAAKKLEHVSLRYHKTKDGTVFPVEISMSMFELDGRKIICAVLRDITELRLQDVDDFAAIWPALTLSNPSPRSSPPTPTTASSPVARRIRHPPPRWQPGLPRRRYSRWAGPTPSMVSPTGNSVDFPKIGDNGDVVLSTGTELDVYLFNLTLPPSQSVTDFTTVGPYPAISSGSNPWVAFAANNPTLGQGIYAAEASDPQKWYKVAAPGNGLLAPNEMVVNGQEGLDPIKSVDLNGNIGIDGNPQTGFTISFYGTTMKATACKRRGSCRLPRTPRRRATTRLPPTRTSCRATTSWASPLSSASAT